MNVQRSPIGELSPIGCRSSLGTGVPNCSGMTLNAPYRMITAASGARTLRARVTIVMPGVPLRCIDVCTSPSTWVPVSLGISVMS